MYFTGPRLEKVKVKLHYGDCTVFTGDAPHGGVTYKQSESETPLMYFAFHIHMHSLLHNIEDSNLDLEYCSEVSVLNDPQCLRHLDPENQVMGVKQMMTKAVEAAKGFIGKGGSKEMKRFLKGVHKKIGDILLEEKEKGAKAVAKKRIKHKVN